MTTSRTPRAWPLRTRITPEAVALFLEIERMSQYARERWESDPIPGRRDECLTKSKHLARLLDLTVEFWGGNNVNDGGDGPCHPPGYVAHADWFKVRRVRERLLAAAAQGKARGEEDRGPGAGEPENEERP
jgi:hypothetical protein